MNTEDFKITRKSYIYDMLNQLGILCSTETKVRNMMANSIPYSYTKIYNQTFMGRIYNKSYIYLPVSNLNNVELWFNGVYIYPDTCSIIGTVSNMSVILLNDKYDDTFSIRYWINLNTVDKVSSTRINNGNVANYHFTYPKKDGLNRSSFYAICDGEFKVPESITETNTSFIVDIEYTTMLDLFICKNIEYCGYVSKDETVLIGNRYNPLICGRYVLNLINYPLLDVRFYPFIKSFEAGFLRAFSDIKIDILPALIPYVRYVNYPENLIINNPYDPDEWDNAKMMFSNSIITGADTEDIVFAKIEDISREYYRIIEFIKPKSKLFESFETTFSIKQMTIDGIIHKVKITNIPYNKNRDILYYSGEVFFDYFVGKIRDIDSQYCEFSDARGYDRLYIIDDSDTYASVDFSILKINSDHNTTIKNISNLITESPDSRYTYLIELNKKIQNMYKNIMCLREFKYDIDEGDGVIISKAASELYSDKTWFEILSIDSSLFNVYVRDILYGNGNRDANLNLSSLWLKTQNEEPANLYQEIIVSNVTQDPTNTDKLLFDLDVPSEGNVITENVSAVGNIEDELFLLANDGTTTAEVNEYLDVNSFDSEQITKTYSIDTPFEEMEPGGIYCEGLETNTDNVPHVVYKDSDVLICEINDSIVKIELKPGYTSEYVNMLIYEDLVLNFRKNEKIIDYNGILPDLLNGKVINESNMLIFDGILRDSKDHEYIHLSNNRQPYNRVVNESLQTYPDLSLIYSTNMKRLSMYKDELDMVKRNELTNKIVNLNQFDIYFDKSNFLLYLNGKYVRKTDISVISKNRFVVNFGEEILRVDLIYDVLAEDIYRLKNIIS